MTADSAPERVGASEHLRRANLFFLGILPGALLLSRGAAEVLIGLISLSFLICILAERRWDYLTEPVVMILIATWLVLNLIVSPLAFSPEASFGRSLPWLRFVLFFAATVMWLLRSPDDFKFVLIAWSAILALAILDGYVQLATGMSLSGHVIQGNRLTGPLNRPNIGIFVARSAFPLLAIALLLSSERRTAGGYIAIAVLAAAAFVFVLLTGERTAAMLTLLAALTLAAIVVFFMPGRRWIGALLAVVVPGSMLLLFHASKTVQVRTAEFWSVVDNFWTSVYGRIFASAFKLWERNPLTGVGLKNFEAACEASVPPVTTHCYQHAHNIYLEWLSESGLVGLACFLAFVTAITMPVLLVVSRAETRLVGAALICGLIVTLFPLAATQSFFSNWPAMVMWTALAVLTATARAASVSPRSFPES
jgi:O-antigen ligase